VFCADLPDAAYLERFYEEKASIKLAEDRRPPTIYKEILRIIDALHPGHSDILDIGCGDGAFLAMSRDAGFTGFGIDSAEKNVRACKARGIDAMCESFPTEKLAGRTFGVIVAIQVLEHLSDPKPFFASCAEILRPGGVLILHTPNARCFSFRIMRGHHRYFIPPEHLCLWSARGFDEAARKASLEIVSIQALEGDHQFRELLAWFLKAKFLHAARWNMSGWKENPRLDSKQSARRSPLASAFNRCFEQLGGNQILCVLKRNSASVNQPHFAATHH
jgi:2-polyprenyl-3-methyl-5-hydroxy-6-metoxy-1,4-benzoquinol methylase